MTTRPDMIGPRPLRPSAGAPLPNYIDHSRYPDVHQAPITTPGAQNGVMPGCRPAPAPTPPQPALIIVEPPMEKAVKAVDGILSEPFLRQWEAGVKSFALYKAIRRHVEYLHKADPAIAVSEEHPHGPDVSTPHHDHARLQAKRVYLTERLAGHRNAGHSPDHPDVQKRQQALGTVEEKLKNYEAAGIQSGPEHHEDWLHHYSKNPAGHSEEHVSAGMSAHIGHLGGEKVQKERQKMSGPSGSMGLKVHPDAPHETHQAMSRKPGSTALGTLGSSAHTPGSKPVGGEAGTRVMRAPQAQKSAPLFLAFAKGEDKKGDDWISNKISLLMHEGKPQKQAIAIAYSMAGRARKSQPALFLSV